MSASRYTLVEVWDDLERNYKKFITENTTEASSEEDQTAYELGRKTIQEMIEVGRAAQMMSMWYPLAKATLGMEAKNVFSKNFGPKEMPPIAGEKSLVFLRDVILPHIECCQKVEFDYIFTVLCSYVGGVDLEKEKEHAAQLAEDYKSIISAANFANEKVNEVVTESANTIIGAPFRFFNSDNPERAPTPVPDLLATEAAVSGLMR